MENYYISQKTKLLKEFDGLTKYTAKSLKSYYDEDLVNMLIREAREEFKNLIPEIPYVGGKENPNTNNLILSAEALALYKVMKAHGKTVEEWGKIVYETIEGQLQAYPRFLLRLFHKLGMTPYKFTASKSRKDAEESQIRQYAEDWVAAFVEGDGASYEWGTDYSECGIIKFYEKQGVKELTQFLCPCDFPIAEAFGFELMRTMTLAEGAEKCDFRYKKN